VRNGLHDGVLGSNVKIYAWTWLIVGAIAAAIGGLSAMTLDAVLSGLVAHLHRLAVLAFYALAQHGGRQPA